MALSKKKRMYPISSIFRTYSILILLIAVTAVYGITYISNKKMIEGTVDAGGTALMAMVNEIDKELEGADQQLYNSFYNSDLYRMYSKSMGTNENYYIKAEISNMLQQTFEYSNLMNGVWYYLPGAEEFAVGTQNVSNMDESQKITENFKAKIVLNNDGNPVESSRWILEQIEGIFYITRMIKIGDTYCGAWVNVESLRKEMISSEENTALAFQSLDGEVKSADERFETLPGGGETYNFVRSKDKSKYIEVSQASETGEYRISYLMQYSTFFRDKFDWDIIIVAALGIDVVILFAVSIYIIQKLIYRPLMHLKDAMVEVQNGNLNPVIEESNLAEFQLLNRTFTYMLDQISDLKINVYEQKLTQQRIKRQYLQIQLKSHFYLNCLNIIYSLAQVKNYKLIQELTRSLGAYFRYTSSDSSELNILQNELEHVRNYMHVQEIRFPQRLVYEEEVDDSLFAMPIPSLILQTFIENSVEHGIDLDKENKIRLHITPKEKDGIRGMSISIQDNGSGFSADELIRFNSADSENLVLDSKDEIGIKNVRSRLSLIYEDKADIIFKNNPDGGAAIELWLPIKPERRGEDV